MRSGLPESVRTGQSMVPAIIGTTTGMAVGLIMSALFGPPPGGFIPVVVVAGLAGMGLARYAAARIRLRRPAVVAGVAIWAVLVVLAAGYVIAAIALSNFE